MSLTGNQKAFAQYLADLWGKPEALGEMCDLFPVGDASEVGLLHSFRISKHQSWKPWKGRIASVVHHWWCHSLQEAFLHYSWPDSPKPNSFQCIAARLRQALAVHDQETARYACLAIFRWGASGAVNLWLGSRINTNKKLYVNRSYRQSNCFSLDLHRGLLHSMARDS